MCFIGTFAEFCLTLQPKDRLSMKYNEETILAITDALRNGDTVEVACTKAGIDKSTFYEWMKDPDKSDFSDAVKNAKAEFRKTIVDRLQKSLWEKALGFDYEERKTENIRDKKTNELVVKTKTVTTKHYPPDTAALIFALTNLAPDEWKNRQNNEVAVKNTDSNLTDEQLQKEIERIDGLLRE